MKKMTCKQLGGACDLEFSAESFDELAEKSKAHGMEMFQQQEPAHMEAMSKMQHLMESAEAMMAWMAERKKEFEALPEA